MKKLLLIFLLILSKQLTFAQYNLGSLDIQETNLNNWYDSIVGHQNTPLLLGTYQDITLGSLDTHPFFQAYSWRKGDLKYRNQEFQDVFMMYNIEEDYLMIKHPDLSLLNQPVRLIQGQIKWFRLEGSQFAPYDLSSPLKSGFYEQLLIEEEISILAHRSKKSSIQANRTDYITFEESDDYVISIQGEFYPYKSRRTLIRLLPNLKGDIRQFARENELFLRAGADDNHLVLIGRFLDGKLSK